MPLSKAAVLFVGPSPGTAGLTVVEDRRDLDTRLDTRWSLVFITSRGDELQADLAHLSQRAPGTPVALLVPGRCDAYLPLLEQNSNVFHLIPQGQPATEWEVAVTTRKALSRALFGIAAYLGPQAVRHETTIEKSSDLGAGCAWVRDRLAERSLPARLRDRVVLAADELVANALGHAPRGTREPGAARLELACDADFVAIGVTDPSGTLTRDRVATALARCARRERDTPRGEDGGAGLFMLLASASSLIVNLEVGTRTEILVLFRIAATVRELRSRPASLHIFQEVEE